MKKLYLLLLAGFSLAAADAQIQFGVKAGANFATLTGSDASGAKMKVGFQGGALVAIPLFNEFSLQPELMYSGEGAKYSANGVSGTLNSNYLNVPVLFKYNNASGFFAETGPQIGFLLSAKSKIDGQSYDAKSSYKSTDFSWAFGLGYLLRDMNIGFDARYNLGLANVEANSNNGTLKNSVIQVGVFYLFGEGAGAK
ncbi:MAG: porin family protein [Chitinophagales bacterium]